MPTGLDDAPSLSTVLVARDMFFIRRGMAIHAQFC